MRTRRFVVFLAAMTLSGGLAPAEERQPVELRTYFFASRDRRERFAAFAAEALAPALRRLRCEPVGLFHAAATDNPHLASDTNLELRLYVVIPHPDAQSVMNLDERLAADPTYLAAETNALATPMRDPLYLRRDTQLLRSFRMCPRVRVPAKGPDRIVQLRIYESHNEDRARWKVHMFDDGGEIAIFDRVGLRPVLFGASVAGVRLPSLIYLLAFENRQQLETAWAAFRADPAWLKLKDDPRYTDTVSQIVNLILRPLPGSDI
ncbi:MAG: NIPSNAP family protein [Kiritimatiellae bacterium]|nr:NIPSNAP family protein [Kiritimatiellia bacterium]